MSGLLDQAQSWSDKQLISTIRDLQRILTDRPKKTITVVYNDCYGGFSLSDKAVDWLRQKGHSIGSTYEDIGRSHPDLVEMVRTLESKSNGPRADLKIETMEVGPGQRLQMSEYDGHETFWVGSIF